ncbi:MAG: 4-hydroxy-tetrahydrodipicolinate reductase [Planctomycetota bacterium]|jgi:4-hydroxy-tetrahydrodipicolinate reductase
MSTRASIGVVLVGASGRLGSLAAEVIEQAPDLHLAHALTGTDDLGEGLTRRLLSIPAGLALDATVAGLGAAHGKALLGAGLRTVIATSGVTPGEIAELDSLARALGSAGLVVPNFSLGLWLLQRFALEASAFLPQVEIIERHHADKRDAPSGSALDTARQLEATGLAPVPIHSVRLEGLYAHQEVQLGAPGETLTLNHDMLGPAAFAPGILSSLRYVRGAEGVACGIAHAFREHPPKA